MSLTQIQKLELAITQCESLSEFEALVNERSHLFQDNWGDHFRELALLEHDLTIQDMALACGVSYSKARSYCTQVPAKRLDVILLAMRMGMTVEQTNDLLVNRAKYHRLYAKNPEDVICIYLLVVGCTKEPAAMFHGYREQYLELEAQYRKKRAGKNQAAPREDTNLIHQRVVRKAKNAELDPAKDPVFDELMRGLLPRFSDSYAKLCSFIDSYFSDRELEDMRRMHNADLLADRRDRAGKQHRRFSANECFGSDIVYLQKYYNAITKIKREHTVPGRLFLVSLGVRLHMTVERINHMLDLAGMGPLCADDRLDAAIVYVLEEVEVQNPTLFYTPGSPGTDEDCFEELQEFSLADELLRLKRNRQQVDRSSELWQNFEMLESLTDQSLNEYLKWRLEDMSIFQGHSKKLRDKLISLL